jgi:hypothetical protein
MLSGKEQQQKVGINPTFLRVTTDTVTIDHAPPVAPASSCHRT